MTDQPRYSDAEAERRAEAQRVRDTEAASLDVERLANVLAYSPIAWTVRRPDGAFVMTRMFDTAAEAAEYIAAAYTAGEGQEQP